MVRGVVWARLHCGRGRGRERRRGRPQRRIAFGQGHVCLCGDMARAQLGLVGREHCEGAAVTAPVPFRFVPVTSELAPVTVTAFCACFLLLFLLFLPVFSLLLYVPVPAQTKDIAPVLFFTLELLL